MNSKHIYRILTHKKSEDRADTLYYRFNDGSQQGFDVKKNGSEEQKNAFRVKNPRHPDFVNPSRNVGHSTTDDKSFYGGAVNYEPLPMNPIVNAANALAGGDSGTGAGSGSADWAKFMGYDIALGTRNYGGDPDIGAIETQRLPKGGAVIYVTPDGAGRRDGSSWANAIAGNTVYVLSGIYGPGLAEGDAVDPIMTCDRILDSEGNPVLTTDSKYNGGFGRVWIASSKYNTTVGGGGASYHDYITTSNVYYGGEKDGTTETEGPTEETSSVTPGESPEDGFEPGYKFDPRYPYGEISGASRTFWRANPYQNGPTWDCSYDNKDAFITACNANGWINNTRAERYVGGLQYAVEKATAYNVLPDNEKDIEGVSNVQVWVSNGVYTDYKGFVMRDKTTVMGGFPAKDGGTPGLDERQALMADPETSIRIPKSLEAEEKGLDPKDYETILQISDVNPKNGTNSFNSAAVRFNDTDLSKVQNITIEGEVISDRVITRSYTWNSGVFRDEVTADY